MRIFARKILAWPAIESISMSIIQHIAHLLTPLYGSREAQAVARWVVEDLLRISPAQDLAGTARVLSDAEQCRLDTVVERLLAGEPVQYVLGKAWFRGREYAVSPAVLIPRPETEDLVELVLGIPLAETDGCRMLDVGTGSGCIAVSLALERPQARVEALDISVEALAVARENARRLGANVHFAEADVLQESTMPPGPWNIIVSNPPYVRESERASLETRVRDHEPPQALFVKDTDPLVFYRHLALWSCQALAAGGHLLVEINAALAEETLLLIQRCGFSQSRLENDRFGQPRFIHAIL